MTIGAGWLTGLVVGGTVMLAGVVALLVTTPKRESARRRLRERFAKQTGLDLPADVEPWLAARLRRRAVASIALMIPLVALLFGWYCGHLVSSLPSAGAFEGSILGWFPYQAIGSGFILVVVSAMALGGALGDSYDYARRRQEAGPGPAERVSALLREALPPVLIWWARALALAPAFAGMAVLGLPGAYPAGTVARGHLWLYLVAAAVAMAVTAGAERLQRMVLRGPGSLTGIEAVVERAFRAETALKLWAVACGVSYLALAAVVAPLLYAKPVSIPVMIATLAWIPVVTVGGLLMLLALSQRWLRRYYQRHYLGGAGTAAGAGRRVMNTGSAGTPG